MKKIITTLLTLAIVMVAWGQTSTQYILENSPVVRITGLDLTGNTYYLLQFVNGSHYYINANADDSFVLDATATITEDNLFCIEQIDPESTEDYNYRLKSKSGKYLGLSGSSTAYLHLYSLAGSAQSLTFVDGEYGGDDIGISVQRYGTEWKAINYSGTSAVFGKWVEN